MSQLWASKPAHSEKGRVAWLARGLLSSSLVLCDKLFELLFGGTSELFNFDTTLVDFESGHGLNAGGLSSLSIGVDINFLHGERGVGLGGCDEDGSDHLAWGAPRGGEVNQQGLGSISGGCSDGGIESGLVSEHQICHSICVCFLVSSKLIIDSESKPPFIA